MVLTVKVCPHMDSRQHQGAAGTGTSCMYVEGSSGGGRGTGRIGRLLSSCTYHGKKHMLAEVLGKQLAQLDWALEDV